MKNKLLTGLVTGLFLLGIVGMANALQISDIDLNTFDFDITNYSYSDSGLDGNAIASGTSNGIGWSISPTNLFTGRTTTDGSFQFSSLPSGVTTDSLHASINFTITFNQVLDSLLVALDNDNTTDSINFGMVPTDYTGVTLESNQLSLSVPAGGGLALFENINSLTVSHTNTNVLDGFDLAFHANGLTPVPEPATMLLFGTGLVGLVGVARRKKK